MELREQKFLENKNLMLAFMEKGCSAKYDYHIHTVRSDGFFTLEEVIKFAHIAGLKRIIITDHNEIMSVKKDLESIPKDFLGELEVFVGCEIACKYFDEKYGKYISIEVVYFGKEVEKVQKFIDNSNIKNKENQITSFEFLKEQFRKNGLVFDENITMPKDMYATEFLARELLKHPENKAFFDRTHPIVWTSPKLFYKKFCIDPESDFYIDTTTNLPTVKEVAEFCESIGGITIVAHPGLYIYRTNEEIKRFLDGVFKISKVKGIETDHSSHSFEQREFLYEYAKANGLKVSGGTDFHSGPQTVIAFGKAECPLQINDESFEWVTEIYK